MLRIPRIIAAGLLALGLTLPALAGVGIRSVPIALSVDGDAHSDFVAGDAPPSIEELDWDIASALDDAGINGLVVGTAFSHDVRQYLSGTEADTATITVLDVSATAPFADPGSGDNLVYDESTSGSGTFRLVATGATGSAQSALRTWAADAGGVPAQVTGLQATVISQTSITVTWNQAAGATTYKAKRDGATIQSGLSVLTYPHTGLTCNTQYSFTVAGTNGSGDGTDSAAVLATTTACGALTFDPPYPRLFLRQMFSNMNGLDPVGSLADFQEAAGWVAKYNAGMGASGRTVSYGNGNYDTSNVINYIKDHPNYDASEGSAFFKYTNATQINTSDTRLFNKLDTETNGHCDWVVRSEAGGNCGAAISNKPDKTVTNFTDLVTDDHNGINWAQWHPRYWWYAPVSPANLPDIGTGSDWLSSSGRGIVEGEWDGVFEDDFSMLTGQATEFNGADAQEDGDDADDDNAADSVVRTAREHGWIDMALEWRDLMAGHATAKYFVANITATVGHLDSWQANSYRGETLRTIFNGGLIEELTGKTFTRKFGNYVTDDNLAEGQPYTGVLGMYRRAMEHTISPRIVAVGHEPEPEFRTKWGTAGTKNNNWICEGGTCATQSGSPNSCTGTGCKYPGNPAHLSDYRLMRWALAFTMMDDGYFSTNQTTSTWTTGLPWYDEYQGGRNGSPGWCGDEVDAPQRAARSGTDGIWYRVFQNCLVGHNPPRFTPNTVQTKTFTVPSAGTGFKWVKLLYTIGGFDTDNSSGTQDSTMNDGTDVTSCGASGSYTAKEIDGFFFKKVAC